MEGLDFSLMDPQIWPLLWVLKQNLVVIPVSPLHGRLKAKVYSWMIKSLLAMMIPYWLLWLLINLIIIQMSLVILKIVNRLLIWLLKVSVVHTVYMYCSIDYYTVYSEYIFIHVVMYKYILLLSIIVVHCTIVYYVVYSSIYMYVCIHVHVYMCMYIWIVNTYMYIIIILTLYISTCTLYAMSFYVIIEFFKLLSPLFLPLFPPCPSFLYPSLLSPILYLSFSLFPLSLSSLYRCSPSPLPPLCPSLLPFYQCIQLEMNSPILLLL